MYRILVVDDEPRVSTGIRNFLIDSDLNIAHVETALNGFEAIDYIRMDSFDLVLTDIQMSRMNGIELMETIYLEQPYLPVIVISAHEKFDFAKKSLRLGARDYLVKPVEQDELLRVVHRVLHEKEEHGKKSLELSRWNQAVGHQVKLRSRREELLTALVTDQQLTSEQRDELASELGGLLGGAYLAVVAVRLDLGFGGFSNRAVSLQDRKLLKYASLNIMDESLSEWKGIIINGLGNELIGIIQVDQDQDQGHMQSQLHLIGQMLHMNLKQYLNVDATIGMSRLNESLSTLPLLLEEAGSAVEWKDMHQEHRVFYYGDVIAQGSFGVEGQSSSEGDFTPIVDKIKAYIQSNYRNSALKIQDIAAEVHFSTAYLSYLFKKEMKKNLWDYVTELRIEEARLLLAKTDKKRYEIAYAVGYESPEHFSRMFKRYAGVSPAEYRKHCQGESG